MSSLNDCTPANKLVTDSNVTESSPELTVRIQRSSGQPLEVQIVRISTSEVKLRTPEILAPHEPILLTISDPAGHTVWRSPGEVHWSVNRPGSHEVGVFLHQRVSDELIAWTKWDRRNQLRYAVSIPAFVWWDTIHESVPVTVVNYSSNGIAILTSEPGHVGRNFLLSTYNDEKLPIIVQGTCCWQVAHELGYLVGCELPPLQGRRFSGRVIVEQ